MPGDRLADVLRADLSANHGNPKGAFVVTAFRLAHWSRVHLGRLPSAPVVALYRLVVDWCIGVELPPRLDAGPGLVIWHGSGLVVHADARLGDGVLLRHNSTIGTRIDGGPAPVLGDGVEVGTGAVILGGVHVGDRAVVGANAVVLHDVPAGAVVAGNPARVIGEVPQCGT
jgi:putative colanic acid biosynthesis acetyltransferase WcaB